ncbi:Zinc finger BED domain-containing protein 4 [Merluccius polli]|uniref:Zinc finger BED domain-containing protein 4 n=1 Tax=Merluccius polli TaxID=89951 RepID=A0AA47PA53_MERPO|nr:Zinc finger BED domain-containing protein 4 [Merluccius polli]
MTYVGVGHALKDDRVSRAIGLCKKVVGHFSHSWKKKAAMTEAQRELKLPEHSLITECPTRWGSKEMMIARVLEQLKAISQVLSGDRYARSLIPSWQDVQVLESIHKALHPLLDFTDALSGEEYVSISYLKPVLHLLATSVLAEDQEDTDLTTSIKTKVLAYLKDKYSDPSIQELLDVASFLDPRFKTQYITADNIPTIKTRLKTEMLESARRAYRQEKRSRTETTPRPQGAQPSGEKLLQDCCGLFTEAELNTYLVTPAIDGEEDPLAWWKVHTINFPRLCNMGRKYLCPCDKCSFRASGNIVTCTRSSLKPAKVDMLVFLAKNLNMMKAMMDSGLASFGCMAHSLQLAVHNGVFSQRSVTDVVAICRKIVGHFKHSPLAYLRLQAVQIQLGMKPKRLQQDIPTRWNSTFYMLESMLEKKRALAAYAADYDLPATLSAHQWQLIENFITLLSPFEQLTREVSSSEASAADVIPSVRALRRLLSKQTDTDHGVKTTKTTLLEAVNKRFDQIECDPMFCIATLLDARYKDRYFDEDVKQRA